MQITQTLLSSWVILLILAKFVQDIFCGYYHGNIVNFDASPKFVASEFPGHAST